jgi:hypothetical protein
MKTGLLRVLTAMCCAVLFIGSCGNPWVEKIVAPLFDDAEPDSPHAVTVDEVPSAAKAITAFYFEINGKKYGIGPGTVSGLGNIDEAAHTITVTIPHAYASSITSLLPVIGHTGASVSPGTAQNFTTPQTYTVRAADGSTQDYTVTVAVKTPKSLDSDGGANDENELRYLISSAENGDTLILSGNFSVSSDASILIDDKDITILATDGNTVTFSPTTVSDGYEKVFEVKNGGTLTLGRDGAAADSIVFAGRSSGGEPFVLVRKDSTFIMNDGVTMRDNTSGIYSMSSALEIRGTAVIYGGTIKDCASNKGGDSSTIYLKSDQGYSNQVSLTIHNVEITNNSAPSDTGGSILVKEGASHTLILTSDGDINISSNSPNTNSPPNGYGSIRVVPHTPPHTIQLNGHSAN